MKIISRYILREHVGPFFFALTALTSLLLLNFISRQFGELVGKGLPKSVIAEFFLLSIPFTVALTLPMSVLVAVLYAFSRLAAENEVTALKASGVSPWRLVTPAIVWGVFMSLFLLAFNDQVLPRANHRLKTLQDDIAQTKPTFLLKPQVINAVQEGKFYLKAGEIDQGNGDLKEVVIYDFGDATRRRTIYADSGAIAMAGKDLELVLHHGQMQEVASDKPNQLDRMFFDHDIIRVRDVAGEFEVSATDSNQRSDRELGICQMQKRLRVAQGRYAEARRDYEEAVRRSKKPFSEVSTPDSPEQRIAPVPPEPGGLGWAYCRLITTVFGVRAAEAAVPQGAGGQAAQDTAKKPAQDTARKPAADTTKRAAVPAAPPTATPPAQQPAPQQPVTQQPAPVPAPGTPGQAEPRVLINGVLIDPRTGLPAPAVATPGVPGQPGVVLGTSTPPAPGSPGAMPVTPTADSLKTPAQIAAEAMLMNKQLESNKNLFISRTAETKLHLDMAEKSRNRFQIEINKKFSLAAACLIFVALGAPLALRFPRGGVGLVIGVSLVVFGAYYVGLIGGESLANKSLMSPFWAMWGTNVILGVIALVLLFRMGKAESSGRGGEWGDRIDRLRDRLRFGAPPKEPA